jgi:hypothetical protein
VAVNYFHKTVHFGAFKDPFSLYVYAALSRPQSPGKRNP